MCPNATLKDANGNPIFLAKGNSSVENVGAKEIRLLKGKNTRLTKLLNECSSSYTELEAENRLLRLRVIKLAKENLLVQNLRNKLAWMRRKAK